VVSTGARTLALFGFQSPGDYATFNSNHTPDGTGVTTTVGLSVCALTGGIVAARQAAAKAKQVAVLIVMLSPSS
jgi:hypothetical protein